MSIAELITRLDIFAPYLAGILIVIPIFSFIYTRWLGPAKTMTRPHNFVLATIVYLSCVPGMFAAVLTAYSLFFLRSNLLEVNALIYFLPLISMIVTLALMRRNVNFDYLPGFDRLRGLMLLLAVTFIVSFLLMQLRIWLFFGGSIGSLLIGMILIFLLLRYGSRLLLRGKQ